MDNKTEQPRLFEVSELTKEREETALKREQNKLFKQNVRKILSEQYGNGKTKMEVVAGRFVDVLMNEEQPKYFLKAVDLLCKLFGDFEPLQAAIIEEKEVDMNKIKTIKNLLDNQDNQE